jgi:hypothetical protein
MFLIRFPGTGHVGVPLFLRRAKMKSWVTIGTFSRREIIAPLSGDEKNPEIDALREFMAGTAYKVGRDGPWFDATTP